jgi:hypothetical protein
MTDDRRPVDRTAHQRTVRAAQVSLVGVALMTLIVVLSTHNRQGNAAPATKQVATTSSTAQTSGSTSTTSSSPPGPASSASSSSAPVSGSTAAWTPDASGRPAGLGSTGQRASAVTATAAPGTYLWDDTDGWHLWVVTAPGGAAVSGQITTDADVGSANSAVAGGTVTTTDRTVKFTLPAGPALAGVDFDPGSATHEITVELTTSSSDSATETIHVGAGADATALPLVLTESTG